MQKILFIINILIAPYSYAQTLSDNITSVFSKEHLMSRIISNPAFTKNNILTSQNSLDRIDFDVIIYSDIFNNEGQTGNVLAEEPGYQIVAYTIHDSIFLKKIAKRKIKRDSGRLTLELETVLSVVDTTRLLKFIENHNYKYHSSWTLNDFFQRSSNYGSFGFLCGGYIPSLTEEAHALTKLVKENDSTALKRLASSFSPQDRAFGSAGLYFLLQKLVQNGQMMSEELLDLIATNQESNIRISYCGGCIVSEQTLAEALELTNLRSMYNLLLMCKLL